MQLNVSQIWAANLAKCSNFVPKYHAIGHTQQKGSEKGLWEGVSRRYSEGKNTCLYRVRPLRRVPTSLYTLFTILVAPRGDWIGKPQTNLQTRYAQPKSRTHPPTIANKHKWTFLKTFQWHAEAHMWRWGVSFFDQSTLLWRVLSHYLDWNATLATMPQAARRHKLHTPHA